MKSYKEYQGKTILTKDGEIANGDYTIDNTIIIRVKNGYLNDVANENGKILPAVEALDGTHIEHWKDGVLHSEKEPAIIDLFDNYEEWWFEGKLLQGE